MVIGILINKIQKSIVVNLKLHMKIILDKKMLENLKNRNRTKIKIFFFWGGCSGTKIDIEEDFDISPDLVCLDVIDGIDIYVEAKDKDKFEWARITKTVSSDHAGKEKIRYIFSHETVKERCGCGSSFSFEKKDIKLDLEKLKKLKGKF